MSADNGEGAEHIGRVVPIQAVEVKIERVKAGAEVAAAFLLIPDEGLAIIAQVAGEWSQVVGGIGKAKHMIADEVAGSPHAEGAVVTIRGDDRKLFDDEPIEVAVPWTFWLRDNEVKTTNVLKFATLSGNVLFLYACTSIRKPFWQAIE